MYQVKNEYKCCKSSSAQIFNNIFQQYVSTVSICVYMNMHLTRKTKFTLYSVRASQSQIRICY